MYVCTCIYVLCMYACMYVARFHGLKKPQIGEGANIQLIPLVERLNIGLIRPQSNTVQVFMCMYVYV